MLIGYKRGQTSIVLRVKILNSSVSTGAGLTGLSSASSGLIISTIADNESSATAYTVAGSTIDTITTLGTYATPTATHCRFKEVDSTNHKGVYEIQLADARFAVSSAKSLLVSISGATNTAECDVVIPLRDLDPYDSVRAGLTALPNAAASAVGGLPLSVDTSGRVDVLKINGTSQTARDIGASVLISSGTGTGQLSVTSGVVQADLQTIKTQTVTCSGGVTVPAATLASTTNITAGTVTTVSGNVNGSVASVTNTNAIADAILLRNASNVESTAGEHTLCTVILAMLENSISGTTLTIKRTDGTTTHATKTLSVDPAAEPIVGIN